MQKITPCLWFDTDGEEAARFYTPCSRLGDPGGSPTTARPARGPRAR